MTGQITANSGQAALGDISKSSQKTTTIIGAGATCSLIIQNLHIDTQMARTLLRNYRVSSQRIKVAP